jgi:two-component system KDP operon response regulator KdpE
VSTSEPAAGQHILIVDDEVQIRRLLRISLKSQGYEVTEAATAKQGAACAADCEPDLVVLDLGLPDADGKQLLAELRERSSVPVIVLSVRDSETEKVLTLDGGANDYVTKPFGIQEFLARVRNLLRTAHQPASEIPFDDGHLRVDTLLRLVSIDGSEVHLTRKEYAVLRILVARGGRVVTRSQLLREVWGPSHLEDTHYLRVLIGKLRLSLGDNASAPRYIRTEPGVGYRFVGYSRD